MKQFLFNIFKRYGQWIFICWTILFLLDFLIISVEKARVLTSMYGFLLLGLVVTNSMDNTRWVFYWRRIAPSIKDFWFGVSAVQLFSVLLNGVIYLTISKFYATESIFFEPTVIDIFWIFLISFSQSLAIMSDIKSFLTDNSLKPARQLFVLLIVYIWLIIIFQIFSFSRILGYLITEISILCWLLMRNIFVVGSIHKKLRYKALVYSVLASAGLSIGSYVLALNDFSGSKKILGALEPQKNIQFSEINVVDNPSSWVRWYKQVKLIDEKQSITALAKLEELCPPQPTDTPTIIECFEKNPIEKGVSLREVYSIADASQVYQLLQDPHVYSKLLGLIAARGLDELSPEIRDAISTIASSGGRLAPVAELTLASRNKDQKRRILIQITNK
jgi:hypothetical protein